MAVKRLLRTEGEGEAATVSLSHEKLFEAWPALREYVAKSGRILIDRTLLESRARKWQEMGKPWFSGLASGREYRNFRRAGTAATPLTNEYLGASRRKTWAVNSIIVMVFGLILGTPWYGRKVITSNRQA
jgi:hypothetical protein